MSPSDLFCRASSDRTIKTVLLPHGTRSDYGWKQIKDNIAELEALMRKLPDRLNPASSSGFLAE